MGDTLNAPVFIKDILEIPVDISATPYFYNDGGTPAYLAAPPAGITPLPVAPTNPAMAMGNEYIVSGVAGVKPTPPWGIETELAFVADEVHYLPLWATPAIAAAFGAVMTQ